MAITPDLSSASCLKLRRSGFLCCSRNIQGLLIFISTVAILVGFLLWQQSTIFNPKFQPFINAFRNQQFKESLQNAPEPFEDSAENEPRMRQNTHVPDGKRKYDGDAFVEAETYRQNPSTSPYNLGLHDETCNSWADDKINIHMVPHSHDDVGWLKTVDQYYWGDKMFMQYAGVQYTIDGVLSHVARQKERKFVIVEMAFLWRWWRRQNEISRNLLRRLLERGQIELICAGWSMADEATVDYVSLIDQHTTGFKFIKGQIDSRYAPLVAWQIDPFGHSREVASLFAEMGMNAMYFSRLDYQERQQREQNRTSEMVWQLRPKSPEMGLSMFTSFFARSNYEMPQGFNFEMSPYSHDPPIMEDAGLDGNNAKQQVMAFERHMETQARQFPSNHMFITMGLDFAYVNANPWFMNMDALIEAFNEHSTKYKMIYSTPSCYTRAVFESTRGLTNKTDDFFPYASRAEAYWTGYFTSRPSLKKMVRDIVNVFTAARQLMALSRFKVDQEVEDELMYLQDAQGILQHHDAVTGTAKQHVTDDYRKRGSQAIAIGHKYIGAALKKILNLQSDLKFCHLINETRCDFIESITEDFTVVTYNQMAEPLQEWVRVPVVVGTRKFQVMDPAGNMVSSDLIPIPSYMDMIATRSKSKATHELVFRASTKPLGTSVYTVKVGSQGAANVAKQTPFQPSSDPVKGFNKLKTNGQVIENGKIQLTLDSKGSFSSFESLVDKVKVDFKVNMAFYQAKRMPHPPSGAYLFNPDGDYHNFVDHPETSLIVGHNVIEVHQKFGVWARAIVRVYAEEDQIEVQWIAGPIPNADNPSNIAEMVVKGNRDGQTGREVVMQYQSNIANRKGEFLTDSNGREMIERVKDYRPSYSLRGTEPISQNYYPLNGRISLKDEYAQMTVLIDRAQGGTGFRTGQLEVMVHRRLTQDDQLGVGESLQEIENGQPLVATGHHWVTLNSPKNAAGKYRKLAQRIMFPQILLFGVAKDAPSIATTSLGQKQDANKFTPALLPENINLMTLEKNFLQCHLLIRLEHLFEGGEDDNMARIQKIEFSEFLTKLTGVEFTRIKVEELALGANMPVEDLVKLKWDTTAEGPGRFDEHNPLGNMPETKKTVKYDKMGDRLQKNLGEDDFSSIRMLPMQIRTFCLTFHN